MLDNEATRLMREALAEGRVLDALCYGEQIIPWGSLCCHGCESYRCGKSITAHGFCPVQQRKVSPHYYCKKWEQD